MKKRNRGQTDSITIYKENRTSEQSQKQVERYAISFRSCTARPLDHIPHVFIKHQSDILRQKAPSEMKKFLCLANLRCLQVDNEAEYRAPLSGSTTRNGGRNFRLLHSSNVCCAQNSISRRGITFLRFRSKHRVLLFSLPFP